MTEKIRWKQRFENYSKALSQLQSALQQKKFSVLEKDEDLSSLLNLRGKLCRIFCSIVVTMILKGQNR